MRVQPVPADVLKGTVKAGSNCMVSLTRMRKQMTQAARVVRASRMSTEAGMDVAIPEGERAFDPPGSADRRALPDRRVTGDL